MEILSIPIENVKGVGAKRASALKDAEILTLGDLLYYLPRRYLDRSQILPMARAPIGQEVTLIGQVRQTRFIPGPRPRFVMVVADETDDITCTFFQGGRYLQRNFAVDDELAISGKIDLFQGRRQMVHPEYEFLLGEERLHTGVVVPLYTTSADMKERGLRSRGFRRLISEALDTFAERIEDDLPAALRQRLGLAELGASLRQVHFPASLAEAERARQRLAFGELFAFQLRLARRRKKSREQADGIAFAPSEKLVSALWDSLPFTPTRAQLRVVAEIAAQMQRPQVMNRLVQGDVGSGKTLVGLCAMLTAVENGYQAAMMAPTEILAEQHFFNIQTLVEPLGLTVVFLKGAQRKALRQELLTAIGKRRGPHCGGHSRADSGAGTICPFGAGGHRRAAPLWGRAARRALQEGRKARFAGDDGHAHPAHLGSDSVRRVGCVGHRRIASRAQADPHGPARQRPPRGDF